MLAGKRMPGSEFARLDVSEGVFFGSILDEANFRDSHCYASDFRAASMVECDLRKAHIQEADLSDADLRGATLTEADLTGARVVGANLHAATCQGTIFRSTDMVRCDLHGADMQRADLEDADLRRANLIDSDLTEARITGAKFEGAVYSRGTVFPAGVTASALGAIPLGAWSDLAAVDLRGSRLNGAFLSRSTFIDVDFASSDCQRVDFTRCVFSGVDFTNSTLDGADFTWSIFLHCRLLTDLGKLGDTEGTYIDKSTELPKSLRRQQGEFMAVEHLRVIEPPQDRLWTYSSLTQRFRRHEQLVAFMRDHLRPLYTAGN